MFVIFDMNSPESIQMQAVPTCSEAHIHKNKSADLASACVDTQIVVILLHVMQVKHLKLMTPRTTEFITVALDVKSLISTLWALIISTEQERISQLIISMMSTNVIAVASMVIHSTMVSAST